MALLAAIGLLTGIVSGLFGVGGGFLLLPLLSLVGYSLHVAVAASLVFVLLSSLSGAARHLRQGTADPRLAVPLAGASAVTAVLGSWLGHLVSERALGVAFAAVTTAAVVLFNMPRPGAGAARTRKASRWVVTARSQVGETAYGYRYHLLGALGVGTLLGATTGLLGIGGGFLLVPMLVTLLGIPLPIAIGSSLLSILAAAAAAIAAHWSLGGVALEVVLPLGLGGIVGAQIGARLVARLPAPRLRLAYNVLLVTVTLYMIARVAGFTRAA